MLTSSPTISAPSSPSQAFHASSHRPYHASRRPSASSSSSSIAIAHSARFSARRFDPPQSPRSAPRVSPSTPSAPSPQQRSAGYVDAGTQYTPPGLPPTYRHPSQPRPHDEAIRSNDNKPVSVSVPAPVPVSAIAPPRRPGDASAAQIVTEPPSAPRRLDPPPISSLPSASASVVPSPLPAHAQDGPSQRAAASEENMAAVAQTQDSAAAAPTADTVMPLQYETCDVKELGVLVSDMLMELVHLNDGFPLRDGTLTRFHSRAPPGISVRDYLSRLIVHATLSPPILLSMVFYVDKLCAMYPAFTISSLTVHRFLITAATVAAKGLSDSFWTNSLYARVGGVSVRELALLELEFLRKLEWRIVPKPEVLVDYYKGLVERGHGYTLEREEVESEALAEASPAPSPTGSATGIHTSTAAST